MRRVSWIVWLIAWSSGCSSADLPPGWEDAELVEGLKQAPCNRGSLGNNLKETLGWEAKGAGVSVTYDQAHFRCEQDVEAYRRNRSDAIDLLVQPIDMDPSSVAGCDCLYEISMQISAARGAHKLTLYRRWDNDNQPNPAVKVDEADVSIP
jgi:hypothetical protein